MGKKVAILVASGFEQEEMTVPKEALEEQGFETRIISPEPRKVRAWKHDKWGKDYKVDVPLNEASQGDFDLLLLPGGVMNPDKLRINERAIEFVRQFYASGKPVAAICHAPWLLINAGIAKDKTLTSYASIRLDLENAGAHWVNEEVATDGNLITSRHPGDLEAFSKKLLDVLQRKPAEVSL